MRFDALPNGIEVAQYDAQSGQISFVLPDQVIGQRADELVHICTPQIDLLVTPDHECLVVERNTERARKVPASQYASGYRQLHAGQYVGGSVDWRDPEIVLLAALTAIGNANSRGADFFPSGLRQLERLVAALEEEWIRYTVTVQKGCICVHVPDHEIPRQWRHRKQLGPWLFDMDRNSFRKMAEEILFWHPRKEESTSAGWLQALFALTGKRARLRQCGDKWQLNVATTPHSLTKDRKLEILAGPADVFCVTVPAGNVIVRRAGRVAITGNCPKLGHGGGASERFKGLAAEFRRMIEAQPGHWLVEADYKSAHALTLGFEAQDPEYCVHPDTRILTNDFTWKKASDLREGDLVVGFDEQPGQGRKRRLRRAVVEGVDQITRPCVLIETDKGSVICSIEHKWLAKNGDNAHLRWIEAQHLRVGNRIAYFVRPWDVDESREGGYVSGIFDGEGSYSCTSLAFSQKPGAVADEACRILSARVFAISGRLNSQDVINFSIVGEAFGAFRALGMFRPKRLLSKLIATYPGTTMNSSRYNENAFVRKVELLGPQNVIALATSTSTFIAEGMQSHNCRLARIDMHSFVAAAGLLRLEDPEKLLSLADPELKARLKWYRRNWHDKTGRPFEEIRNIQAKPAILGYGFAMGPGTLFNNNPDSFQHR